MTSTALWLKKALVNRRLEDARSRVLLSNASFLAMGPRNALFEPQQCNDIDEVS